MLMSQRGSGRRRKRKSTESDSSTNGSSVEPRMVPLMNDDWAYAESVDLKNRPKTPR